MSHSFDVWLKLHSVWLAAFNTFETENRPGIDRI